MKLWQSNVQHTKNAPALGVTCFLALMMLFAAPGVVLCQDDSANFEPPSIPQEKTIEGQSFGGETADLEGIDGEAVSGKASLQDPNFGEYGLVTSAPARASSDQRSVLDGKPEFTDRSQQLPNQYRGTTIEPDWMKSSNSMRQDQATGSVESQEPSSSRRSSIPQSSFPQLQIDSLSDVKQLAGKFSSDGRPSDVIKERYEDGSIKIIRNVIQDDAGNYYNHGGWLRYDRQQRPVASGTYFRGTMDGQWERIHEAGSGGLFSQLPFSLFQGPYLSKATFKKNRLDGVWTISDRSGKLICSITYRDGVRNGAAKWFYPRNQQTMREVTFKDGVPDGFVDHWDQQGNLKSRERFVDGRKIVTRKSTFANQSIESQREFRDQQLSPVGQDNWWAAKPATFERIGEPVQHGAVFQWYPNRQPKMSGRFVNGKRDGLFTWWHPTQNKKAEGSFTKGKRQGKWLYWHESGMKRSEGEFKDDEPWGRWRTWNSEGTLIDERTFPLESAEPDPSTNQSIEIIEAPTSNDADQPEIEDQDSDIEEIEATQKDQSGASTDESETDDGSGQQSSEIEVGLESIAGESVEADPGSLGNDG